MTKRKIYYVPGMISLLLLLPLLLYEWSQKELASRDLRVLEVITASPMELLTDPIYSDAMTPPDRDYLTLVLSGNLATDKIKLAYAQIRIRELETSGDQTYGVKIHFTDSTKYTSMVRAFDMLHQQESDTIRWLWLKQNIWCFAAPPTAVDAVAEPLLICGTAPMFGDPVLTQEPMEDVAELFKSYWPIALTFTGLVLCVVYAFLQGGPPALKLMRVFTQTWRRQ